MITENFGFIKEDVYLYLDKIKSLNNSMQLKEVYIDVYQENPLISSSCFTLILRTFEKNATILVKDGRIIFERNDVCRTHFVNVIASKITECFSKISDNYYEFILNVQNIYYKITITN